MEYTVESGTFLSAHWDTIDNQNYIVQVSLVLFAAKSPPLTDIALHQVNM
jgi:hypothetical protein